MWCGDAHIWSCARALEGDLSRECQPEYMKLEQMLSKGDCVEDRL